MFSCSSVLLCYSWFSSWFLYISFFFSLIDTAEVCVLPKTNLFNLFLFRVLRCKLLGVGINSCSTENGINTLEIGCQAWLVGWHFTLSCCYLYVVQGRTESPWWHRMIPQHRDSILAGWSSPYCSQYSRTYIRVEWHIDWPKSCWNGNAAVNLNHPNRHRCIGLVVWVP